MPVRRRYHRGIEQSVEAVRSGTLRAVRVRHLFSGNLSPARVGRERKRVNWCNEQTLNIRAVMMSGKRGKHKFRAHLAQEKATARCSAIRDTDSLR